MAVISTSSGTAAEITSLAQSVAKRLYDSGNGAINAEVTGRTTQIEGQRVVQRLWLSFQIREPLH
jgi:hypothetical protein